MILCAIYGLLFLGKRKETKNENENGGNETLKRGLPRVVGLIIQHYLCFRVVGMGWERGKVREGKGMRGEGKVRERGSRAVGFEWKMLKRISSGLG